MEPFDIQWRASTKKDLRKLPPAEVARIVAAVEELAHGPYPHGTETLSGSEQTSRIRMGDYRVVYEVLTEPKIVEVQRVRHHKDVYRP